MIDLNKICLDLEHIKMERWSPSYRLPFQTLQKGKIILLHVLVNDSKVS